MSISKKTSNNPLMKELQKLNEMEKKYFRIILAQSGVLYIAGKPGTAKSAILRSIANKLNINFIDIRLSMVDETDVGIYPTIGSVEDKDGKKVECLNYIPPKWAIEANNKPTLIIFEELNRASLPVRNASLQILNEREVAGYKLNDNVFMVASGNLGEEDGTDVEEMDNALINRLVMLNHDLSLNEWIDYYAEDNVHPLIINFLNAYPSYYYKFPTDDQKSYPTPRSWTNLSKYIEVNWGFDSMPQKWLKNVEQVIHGFVGIASSKFLKFADESKKITAKQILNNFDKYSQFVAKMSRSQKSEILYELKSIELKKLKMESVENLVAFLKFTETDERGSFLNHVIDYFQDLNIDIFDNTPKVLDKIINDFDEEYKAMRKAMRKHNI